MTLTASGRDLVCLFVCLGASPAQTLVDTPPSFRFFVDIFLFIRSVCADNYAPLARANVDKLENLRRNWKSCRLCKGWSLADACPLVVRAPMFAPGMNVYRAGRYSSERKKVFGSTVDGGTGRIRKQRWKARRRLRIKLFLDESR